MMGGAAYSPRKTEQQRQVLSPLAANEQRCEDGHCACRRALRLVSTERDMLRQRVSELELELSALRDSGTASKKMTAPVDVEVATLEAQEGAMEDGLAEEVEDSAAGVLKQGWLRKKVVAESFSKPWRSRLVVLRSAALEWFKVRKSDRAEDGNAGEMHDAGDGGCLQLVAGSSAQKYVDSETEGGDGRRETYVLVVSTDGVTLLLGARSEVERDAWLDAVQLQIQLLQQVARAGSAIGVEVPLQAAPAFSAALLDKAAVVTSESRGVDETVAALSPPGREAGEASAQAPEARDVSRRAEQSVEEGGSASAIGDGRRSRSGGGIVVLEAPGGEPEGATEAAEQPAPTQAKRADAISPPLALFCDEDGAEPEQQPDFGIRTASESEPELTLVAEPAPHPSGWASPQAESATPRIRPPPRPPKSGGQALATPRRVVVLSDADDSPPVTTLADPCVKDGTRASGDDAARKANRLERQPSTTTTGAVTKGTPRRVLLSDSDASDDDQGAAPVAAGAKPSAPIGRGAFRSTPRRVTINLDGSESEEESEAEGSGEDTDEETDDDSTEWQDSGSEEEEEKEGGSSEGGSDLEARSEDEDESDLSDFIVPDGSESEGGENDDEDGDDLCSPSPPPRRSRVPSARRGADGEHSSGGLASVLGLDVSLPAHDGQSGLEDELSPPMGRQTATTTPAAKRSTAPKTAKTPGSKGVRTPSWAQTQRDLRELAPRLYAEYNEVVFGGRLPRELCIVWSAKLQSTAGRCHMTRRGGQRQASIDLSDKVIDREERLRKTLAHEMCHAAQWLLDGNCKPPHGPAFWRYADLFGRRLPGMKISTCHTYDIFHKFRYGCDSCGNEFGRQSKSVDVERQRCGRCHGKLRLLGAFNRDGTPAKAREPSAFARFVKDHFSALRVSKPEATHGELMADLGQRWRDCGGQADSLGVEPSGWQGREESGNGRRLVWLQPAGEEDELASRLGRVEL